jgi:hypothetical protein
LVSQTEILFYRNKGNMSAIGIKQSGAWLVGLRLDSRKGRGAAEEMLK